ncbi:MAG: TlpA family protein disulfide reductase [Planctomycetota bacterium]
MTWTTCTGRHLLWTLLLIATAPAAARAGEFPDGWYFYETKRPAALKSLEGRPAPVLAAKQWHGEAQDLDELKGKVVVVDFWGTWCPPCMRSIPKNVSLVEKYGDKGLVFVGVHDSKRGTERIPQVIKGSKINYPVAVDDNRRSEQAWKVRFWPTYAVLDRDGIVRAAGLKPEHVESVVQRLLAEGGDDDAAAAPGAMADDDDKARVVPPTWLEGTPAKRQRLKKLERASSLPAIESPTWLNSEPLDLQSLRGKVVLLDFWATWCGPCIASIPKMNQLHAKYESKGLVVIGVCHPRGVEKMSAVASDRGIRYPICADAKGDLVKAYAVDSFPDYYLIDREGQLRVADLSNKHVEDAIRLLLAEQQ